jgi:chemotaxis protein methyltransferase CheR
MCLLPFRAVVQWALPRLRMRWAGFRKVRRQVCRRVWRRARELGLADLVAYRAYLEEHPGEWALLDSMTRITISRFYRDRGVFGFLEQEVLPMLAAEAVACDSGTLEVWSAGCASGEEPYTVALIWQLELTQRFSDLSIQILATDLDQTMLTRARRACFTTSSLKELPEHWRTAAFLQQGALHCVRDHYKQAVMVARHDIRTPPPHGPFDLVMCRNLAFTYFDRDLQRATGARLADVLRPGGALVLGGHEALPKDLHGFEPWSAPHRVYRRVGNSTPHVSDSGEPGSSSTLTDESPCDPTSPTR